MREIGLMIKRMEKANIFIWMVQYMKGSGLKINSMVLARKPGLTPRDMKDNINMDKSMDKGHSFGVINQHIQDNS